MYVYEKLNIIKGLNMLLVSQVSVNFEISHSSELYTNLVIHL